jgi:hypothetical protein
MGAWGKESCSSDSCWDNLWAKNIHHMTQKEADNSLKKSFSQKNEHKDLEVLAAQLGVIIWILRQGLVVKKEYLLKGKAFAHALLSSKEYLDNWVDSEKRAENLNLEIKDIDEAIKNGGLGKKEHVPGLFEKMNKAMA